MLIRKRVAAYLLYLTQNQRTLAQLPASSDHLLAQLNRSMVNLGQLTEDMEMISHINEELVVQAAREWAARANKSYVHAVENALETMSTLRGKLSTDEYQKALEKLYREYNES